MVLACFKFEKSALSAEGCHKLTDHSAELFAEGPTVIKGTLMPDFQAYTRPRIFFLKPMSPQNTGRQ